MIDHKNQYRVLFIGILNSLLRCTELQTLALISQAIIASLHHVLFTSWFYDITFKSAVKHKTEIHRQKIMNYIRSL